MISSNLRITTENSGILDQNHIIWICRLKKQLPVCNWVQVDTEHLSMGHQWPCDLNCPSCAGYVIVTKPLDQEGLEQCIFKKEAIYLGSVSRAKLSCTAGGPNCRIILYYWISILLLVHTYERNLLWPSDRRKGLSLLPIGPGSVSRFKLKINHCLTTTPFRNGPERLQWF